MSREVGAIGIIAYRDIVKFLKDKPRILTSLIFPVIFIGFFGKGLQASIGQFTGFNYLTFVFTGILAQTLYQSTASGVIWLIRDRESDFSQEIFISPVSRYSIIFGKIFGESLVALTQAIGIVAFGLVIAVPFAFTQIVAIIPIALIACFLGGAFGVLVLSLINSQRAVDQIFPLLLFPQFFLAGVFSPIDNLPPFLSFLSRITPMTYAVDLMRNVFYAGTTEYGKVVLHNPTLNITVSAVMFAVFLVIGTRLFVRKESNR